MESLLKKLDEDQASVWPGYLHGHFDELAVFLSVFERGLNSGCAHSIDRSRVLTL